MNMSGLCGLLFCIDTRGGGEIYVRVYDFYGWREERSGYRLVEGCVCIGVCYSVQGGVGIACV